MKVDGGCHCGAITYEAEIIPEEARLCHCTDCQRMAGTPFRHNVPTTEGSFKLLTGDLAEYEKIAESGNKRILTFCRTCGTQISSTVPGPEPKGHNLRVGSITQRADIPPQIQIWHEHAQGWLKDLNGIKTITGQ
jgi:hypothetical protein